MFSMYNNLMDPCGQHQRFYRPNPCFADLGRQRTCQNGPWPFADMPGPREMPTFEEATHLCPPLAYILQFAGQGQRMPKTRGKEESKGQTKSCNAGEGCQDRENTSSKLNGVEKFQQELQNVLGNVMTACSEQRPHKKWQQKVDCRGFESKNIRVKIEGHQLHLKAFRKEQSKDGGMRTSGLRKMVPIPENVNNKKVSCKLAPNGIFLVEAPYIDVENKPDNQHEFVKELINSVFPGLENVMKSWSECDKHTKESSGEKSDHKENDPEQSEGAVGGESVANDSLDEHKKDAKSSSRTHKTKLSEENATPGLEQEMNTERKQQEVATECKQQEMTTECKQQEMNAECKQQEMTTECKQQEMNAECKQQEVDTECGIDVADDTGLVESDSSQEHVWEQAVPFPNEELQGPEVHSDDRASVLSEDSFVLLSQLEKDSNDDGDVAWTPAINRQGSGVVDQDDDDDDEMNQKSDTFDVNVDTEHSNGDHEYGNEVNDPEDVKRVSSQLQPVTPEPKINGEQIVLFRLEMPSYNPESMRVDFDDSKRVLTVSASKHGSSSSSRPGASVDTITKSVAVDDTVDAGHLQCFFRDGTLTVTAPCKRNVRNIPIKA